MVPSPGPGQERAKTREPFLDALEGRGIHPQVFFLDARRTSGWLPLRLLVLDAP